jgi:hypothetical protein
MLSPAQLQRAGLFNPAAVGQLVKKCEQGGHIGETDEMALAGILSTQLAHHHFVADFKPRTPLAANDRVKVCTGQQIKIPA